MGRGGGGGVANMGSPHVMVKGLPTLIKGKKYPTYPTRKQFHWFVLLNAYKPLNWPESMRDVKPLYVVTDHRWWPLRSP